MAASHDSETPAEGKQVITACALVWHEFDGVKKVFLPKRAATKKFLPNVYEMVGGHIDYGEDIIAGLKREALEELGMRISVGDAFASFTYLNTIKGSHSVEVVFFGKFLDPIENIKISPEDHSTFEWFSIDDVRARKDELRPEMDVPHAYDDDPEYLAIIKGLELLNGHAHNFG